MKTIRSKKSQVFVATILAFTFITNVVLARSVTVDNTGKDETVITVEIELCPDPADDPKTEKKEGPTKEELEEFAKKHEKEVENIWNACSSKLRIKRGDPRKQIRFDFKFTVIDDCEKKRDPNKHRFKVHPGAPPSDQDYNANTTNLWMENTSRTIAHELGHVMGLDEDYRKKGKTRKTLMGRGSYTKLKVYMLMTILFINHGDPDDKEAKRRRLMKTLLRMKDQELARRIAVDNDITKAQYDAYKDQFDVNGTTVQPDLPK